jgi:hypothetical protein
MELEKNKITKFEQIKDSPIWKWIYIALVIIISIGYFIFSYYYIQESRYVEIGGVNLEVKDEYVFYVVFQHFIGISFLLMALLYGFRGRSFFWSSVFLIFWLLISFSNYLIAKLTLFLML